MSVRAVFTCALICIAVELSWARSAGQPEPEYKIQYYVPQQQYLEQEEGVSHQQQQTQQPRYITSPQAQTYQAQQHARPQYEAPTHRVAQLLLPSSADRQVIKFKKKLIFKLILKIKIFKKINFENYFF